MASARLATARPSVPACQRFAQSQPVVVLSAVGAVGASSVRAAQCPDCRCSQRRAQGAGPDTNNEKQAFLVHGHTSSKVRHCHALSPTGSLASWINLSSEALASLWYRA